MATEVKNKWAFTTEPFGDPTLSSDNNGSASWVRDSTSPLGQKGSTGWLAKLNGGVQTNDDWARVNIPVNEMSLPAFATAKWSYYMAATQSMGVNIVIWVHDPTDFDNRAEITQVGGHADLEKAAGWNAFEFSSTTGGMFYYGEGVSGSDLDAGTQYTWHQFRQDPLFKTWDIYRITLDFGWEASGTFGDVWIADLQLDGKMIPLKPELSELLIGDVDPLKVTSIGLTGGKKVVVEPMLWTTGTGESFLTRGEGGHGLVNLQGYGWRGEIHLAGDIITLTIPLDIKLRDIKSATWLEKCSTDTTYNNTLQTIWQIDYDGNGVYTETSDDRFLFNSWQNSYGNSSWGKVNGIANVNLIGEALDTFKLHTPPWTQTATDDGTIDAGEEASFAAFQATDLGNYRVKAMQIVYSGEKTGTADFWIQAANFEFNGVFYELQPKPNRILYKEYTGAGTIAATLAPHAPFRLMNVMLHLDAAATQEDFTVTCDAGRTADVYDTLLYSKNLSGVQDIVRVFGEGYEFLADDEIDVAWTNSDTATYGLTYAYQLIEGE